ncbi:porin family protein [Mariniflexile gromovii]|uniref:PorT family protein n=1 Tax=Mariniflexile gromovii TaxID=362523 RepID=A0ABS4BU02_9FLAO|nr:porin family protein [Mariniflexile gromovii]MBP0904066.1 PorT family protein [Mariniflexile gromovii]
MKFRILMITSLTLLICKIATAQEVKWGIKAGVNMSTLKTDLNEEKYLFGYHVGGLAEIKFSEKFLLQPELLYSLLGGKIEDSFSFDDEGTTFSMDYKEDVKLAYLQLPIMLKYHVAKNLNMEVGPQIGYLLSAKSDYEVKMKFDDEDMTDSGSEKIKDQVKSLNFGLNFGLGYEFNNKMFIQGRYHLGLSDINDSETSLDEESIDRGSIKNNSFQVSVGFKF